MAENTHAVALGREILMYEEREFVGDVRVHVVVFPPFVLGRVDIEPGA